MSWRLSLIRSFEVWLRLMKYKLMLAIVFPLCRSGGRKTWAPFPSSPPASQLTLAIVPSKQCIQMTTYSRYIKLKQSEYFSNANKNTCMDLLFNSFSFRTLTVVKSATVSVVSEGCCTPGAEVNQSDLIKDLIKSPHLNYLICVWVFSALWPLCYYIPDKDGMTSNHSCWYLRQTLQG